MAKITVTPTRFGNLAIRGYISVTRVGVPGHRKPFADTWYRFTDVNDDADIGPSFKTKAEAFANLPEFAKSYYGDELPQAMQG